MASTEAGRAQRTADLLNEALAIHADHPDGCPVCGSSVDASWRERTQAEIDRLRALATDAAQVAGEEGAIDRPVSL